MENIKNFNTFLNELKTSTYKSAAEKLKDKGHKTRAKELVEYSKTKIKESLSKIEPFIFKIGDEKFKAKAEWIDVNVLPDGDVQIWVNLNEKESMDGVGLFFNKKGNDFEHADIDGLVIDNRKTANKMYNLIKDTLKILSEDDKYAVLKDIIGKFNVNDLYSEKK